MMQQNETKQQYTPNADAGVIQLRLSTYELLEDIKDILQGQAPSIKQNEDGSQQIVKIKISDPLVNDKGFQMIYGLVRSCINNAVVQGNNNERMFEYQVYDFEKTLAMLLTCNYEEWGLNPEDRNVLQLSLTTLVINFLSRTIGNKERESYGVLERASSTNTVQAKGIFGGNQ